ncbi:hypothetical protein ACL1EZ_14550, partial [Corynebacterium striatum]
MLRVSHHPRATNPTNNPNTVIGFELVKQMGRLRVQAPLRHDELATACLVLTRGHLLDTDRR